MVETLQSRLSRCQHLALSCRNQANVAKSAQIAAEFLNMASEYDEEAIRLIRIMSDLAPPA